MTVAATHILHSVWVATLQSGESQASLHFCWSKGTGHLFASLVALMQAAELLSNPFVKFWAWLPFCRQGGAREHV